MDEEKAPVDILDEILNRPENPLPSPTPYPPKFDPPLLEDDPPPSPPEKKPSPAERLLPWLCALLGGAVLALALCGIQLFSVNARLDGLQTAVGEIQAVDELRAENKKLKTDQQAAESAQKEAWEIHDDLQWQLQRLEAQYNENRFYFSRATLLSWLERFCAEEDWLMAACAVEYGDPQFNPRTSDLGWAAAAPFHAAGTARYFQLRELVLDRAGSLVVERYDFEPEGDSYTERVYIDSAASRYGEQAVETARLLWQTIIKSQVNSASQAATALIELYNSGEHRARLRKGVFQPSTVEALEQVKESLIQSGWIKENGDGTLSVVTHYGQDGLMDPAMIPLGENLPR